MSSYKPKLLEIFLREREDSVPELIQIKNIPQRDQVFTEINTKKKVESIKKDKKLDLSSCKYGIQKEISSICMEDEQERKATKRLTSEINNLQRKLDEQVNRNVLYKQKIQQLQKMIDESNYRLKQFDYRIIQLEEINQHLENDKLSLQKQIKHIKLEQNRSYVNAKKQKFSQDNQQIFQKIKHFLKQQIDYFIQVLSQQDISKSTQKKIQDFLNQLLKINDILPVDQTNHNNTKSVKASYKYKDSYSQSPIAKETYVDQKYSNYESPQEQSRIKRKQYYISKLKQKQKKDRQNKDQSICELPRFNYLRETTDPGITTQSAFMSINHFGKSIDKSYDGKDRSRSQRRRKIFQRN